jgi:hypothetical protein
VTPGGPLREDGSTLTIVGAAFDRGTHLRAIRGPCLVQPAPVGRSAQIETRLVSAAIETQLVFATLQRPGCRCERLIDVDLEMAPLQPAHEDPRKARDASIRVAFAPIDVDPWGQVAWIGSCQEPRERIETHRIERLHHQQPVYGCDTDQAVLNSTGHFASTARFSGRQAPAGSRAA